ncbi:hypothetical protein HKBW3S25_00738, partial [Candidatus Hakubella thermalkaliphila]
MPYSTLFHQPQELGCLLFGQSVPWHNSTAREDFRRGGPDRDMGKARPKLIDTTVI